jgi:hypothetical protein
MPTPMRAALLIAGLLLPVAVSAAEPAAAAEPAPAEPTSEAPADEAQPAGAPSAPSAAPGSSPAAKKKVAKFKAGADLSKSANK